jgi:hypothetical protein
MRVISLNGGTGKHAEADGSCSLVYAASTAWFGSLEMLLLDVAICRQD